MIKPRGNLKSAPILEQYFCTFQRRHSPVLLRDRNPENHDGD